MNYALIIAIIISFPCALLSVFLVLKGWALIGDAMNHAMFPGIVLAWIIGMPLGIGAFIVGLSCAIATGYLKDNSIIKKDTIIGIVFSGIFVLTINRHKSADYRYHYYITVILHGIAYHFCHIKSSRNYSVYILLIAPRSIAVLITHRFHKALLIAVTISITISGVWLLYFLDRAPAPTIVLLFAVAFLFALIIINFRKQ